MRLREVFRRKIWAKSRISLLIAVMLNEVKARGWQNYEVILSSEIGVDKIKKYKKDMVGYEIIEKALIEYDDGIWKATDKATKLTECEMPMK